MIYYSESEQQTAEIGEKMGQAAKQGDVFCLNGDLGAGKTVFSKGFARGLGIKEHITSPTFTVVNEYVGRLSLYHFDAYRLEGANAAYCFEFEEYFEAGGVCLIEWAENIADVLPKNAVYVKIERAECENRRIITISNAPKG